LKFDDKNLQPLVGEISWIKHLAEDINEKLLHFLNPYNNE